MAWAMMAKGEPYYGQPVAGDVSEIAPDIRRDVNVKVGRANST
jgi:hypothetical protein